MAGLAELQTLQIGFRIFEQYNKVFFVLPPGLEATGTIKAAPPGSMAGDRHPERGMAAGNRQMAKRYKIKWLGKPEAHDYPAALSYLSLLYDGMTAAAHVDKLKRALVTEFQAKDILRASGLPLLGISNVHVKKDQKEIRAGRELSPLLLIRDSADGKVIIADGYHRLCAVYSYDEDAVIPCNIV